MTFWSENTLPRPFDKKRAGDILSELLALAKAQGDSLLLKRLKVGKNKALITSIAGNSPYLGQLILKNPIFFKKLLVGDPDKLFNDLLKKTARKAAATHKENNFKTLIRALKSRAALLIAIADISGHWDLTQSTYALSRLADLCLKLSLSHILHEAMEKGRLAWPENKPEPATPALSRNSGFVILSLGKLGSNSLNYSSDVDLILLYDEARVELSDQLPKAFFTKVSQKLVTLMAERTADGYCFRVDLRLRPDPGTTPPAVSFAAAEIYYHSVAETWERAAMIKARVSAGDLSVGIDFLSHIRHFVWRRHMDFAAVEDIHAIKDRILRHYGHDDISLEGHNIKIGEGGIRSIEFFVQIQQLIAGGRNPELRASSTREALQALNIAGIIDSAQTQQLDEAYEFLRTIEHRLQMINDEQTQTLPESDEGMAHLATFLGFDEVERFKTRLLGTLSIVKRHYDTLPGISEEKSIPAFLKSREALERRLFSWGFSEASASTIDKWDQAPYKSLKSPRARKIFANLLPEILESFSRSADPDKALDRFDDFVSKLPSGVQIFALFQNNPWVFQVIGKILTMAPNLASELARRPDLMDYLLNPTFFDPPGDKKALKVNLLAALTEAGDHEEVLDITRQWLNEMRFQTGIQLLEGLTSSAEAGRHRANMAETVLETLLPHVTKEFEKNNGTIKGGELAIIALGSFGGRELTAGSDLDLVLLFDAPEGAKATNGRGHPASQYYIRLGQHFLTSLSAMMGSGKLYEVDLRLRPSGRWGPLVVTLASFLEYQKASAWTVEHMALTRGRVVLAGSKFRKKIEKGILGILAMKRDPLALAKQMAEVREKYFLEHGTESVFGVRQVRGGLIDAEYILQFYALTKGHENPDVFDPDFATSLDNLLKIKAFSENQAKLIEAAHDLFLEIHGLLRLCHEENPKESGLAPSLLTLMASTVGVPSGPALRNKLIETQKAVSGLYKKTFSS